MKKRSTSANQRLDVGPHLTHMSLTCVACESIEATHDITENSLGIYDDLSQF